MNCLNNDILAYTMSKVIEIEYFVTYWITVQSTYSLRFNSFGVVQWFLRRLTEGLYEGGHELPV